MSEQSNKILFQSRFSPSERKFILFLGDVIATFIAFIVALYIWGIGDDWLGMSPQFLIERVDNWFYLLPVMWVILLFPILDSRRSCRRSEVIKHIGLMTLISVGAYLLIFFLAPPRALPRRGVAVFIGFASVLNIIWRMWYIKKFTVPEARMKTIIVGAGKAGTTISHIIQNTEPEPMILVGFIDDDPEKQGMSINGLPVLCDSSRFFEEVEKNGVSQIIMAITHKIEPTLFDALTRSEEMGLRVVTMAKAYEDLQGRVPVFLLDTDWMLRTFYDQAHAGAFFEMLKRTLDVIGAIIGLILLAILLPFIALAIFIDNGTPIFYTQERLGLRSKPFRIIKFRTMVNNAEGDGKPRLASDDDDRVTRIGHFLRRSHLDEMPQFVNVLRGDVSLVGPRAERPAIVADLQKEIPFYRGRLLVRPGVTGWAQVNYGYASTVEQNAVKLEYDLYYIKHRNLFMDFSIILRTIRTMVGLQGR